MRTLAAVLFCWAISGCAEAPPEVDEAPAPSPIARAPLPDSETPYFILGSNTPPDGVRHPPPRDSLAREAWMEDLFAAMRREVEIKTQINGTDDWRAADAIARRQVGQDSLVRPAIAVAMLNHHLLRGDLDGDKAEALGRYTQSLLDQESQEGAMILWALKRLDGYWDEPQIRRAASASANHLGAAFVRLARCVDCTIADAVDGLWPQARETSTDQLNDIADVHRELVRLTDGDD